MGKPLGIVVGMQVERDLLETAIRVDDRPPRIACAGASAPRARAAAEGLVREGCGSLLSFGIAGGLDPELTSGTKVLATVVVGPDGARWPTDDPWRRRLLRLDGMAYDVRSAPLVGSDTPITSTAAKADLFARSQAAAVDMESHAVAAAAAAAGVPFLALRVIADPAQRAIPEVALEGLGPDGETRPWAVARRLLREPWLLPALARLRHDTEAALDELIDVAGLELGPA